MRMGMHSGSLLGGGAMRALCWRFWAEWTGLIYLKTDMGRARRQRHPVGKYLNAASK